MRGYQNISSSFSLESVKREKMGAFDWQTRMGIHLAFHRDPMNILLHVIMPPFNALGVFLCFYPFVIADTLVLGEPINLALVVFAASVIPLLLVDVLAAFLTALPMAILYPACAVIYAYLGESTTWMIIIGSSLFLFALWIQVAIGHSVCEKGIGDEDENIAEMFESKNPIYFVLLPIYPILDFLFLFGYRKKAARYVMGITNELRPLVEHRKRENPHCKGI